MNLLNEIQYTYNTTKVYGNEYANKIIAEKIEKYLNYCLEDEVKELVTEEYGSIRIASHILAQHITSNNGTINESIIKEEKDELLEGLLGSLIGKGLRGLGRRLMKRGSKLGKKTVAGKMFRKAGANIGKGGGKLITRSTAGSAASTAAGQTVGRAGRRLTIGGVLTGVLSGGRKMISGTCKFAKKILGSKLTWLAIGGVLVYNNQKWVKDENGNLIFGGQYQGNGSEGGMSGGYDLYSKAYGRPYQYVNKKDYEL